MVIELPFLVTRYRREGAWLFVVSGALIGAFGATLLLLTTGLEQASRAVQVGVVLTSTLSSVAVAVVSLLAARALARAGVGRRRPRQSADATVEPAEQR